MSDVGTGGLKKYHRLASKLRRQIEAGVYRPGDRLPSESQLMQRLGVSQNTIRAAIGVLRAEGLVVAVHGSGTFVRQRGSPRRVVRGAWGRVHDGWEVDAQQGHQFAFAGRVPAPADIAELMGVSPGDDVIVRRHTLRDPARGTAVELGASWLPLTVAADTYLEQPVAAPKPLPLCVEELTGRRYRRAHDRLSARLPSVEEAAALGIEPANPVLRLLHAAYDEDDEVLEVAESVWAADAVTVIDDYDLPDRAVTPPRQDVPARGHDMARSKAWI